ncbi:MAG: zinc-ribbon domain-containing protein [Candidatus Heimdallarchaeota archaeon]|nr:zinc-ribbon domain-containing protein [Candidatus Heimdallarchaeota archaeon]
MSTQEHTLVKTLRCPSCGAPMKPSAESLLIICNFCGEIVAESKITPHAIIQPLPMTPPQGFGTVRQMELILIPFFDVKADVNMEAAGYQRRERTETKTVRRGNQTYTETKTIVEYRPWKIYHQGSHSVRFLARQEITMFGASELISFVTRSVGGQPVPFSPSFIKNLASQDTSRSLVALSPEWNQDDAAKKAGETVYEAAYQRAKSEMHEVFDTKVQFKALGPPTLLHEPLLLIRRNIQGRSYRAAYHWGSGQLLREEQPIKNRKLMIFFAMLFFFGAPPLVQVGYNLYGGIEDNVWYVIVLSIIAVILVGLAIFLLVRSFKPHKIKSSGAKVSLFDFQQLAPEQRAAMAQQISTPSAKGQPIPKFCPKCRDPLEPNQQFCEKCGHRIDGR